MPVASKRLTADVYANTATARARLSGLAGRATDLRPAMQVVKGLIIEGHKRNFMSKGGEFGTRWAPNAAGTLAKKARLGQGSSPLEATGALKTALFGGRGRSTRVTKSGVRVGVRLMYARYNLGESRYRPARPMVGVSPATERAAYKVIERYLVGR